MKGRPDTTIRGWHCWCCNTWFVTDWDRFKEHLDECELKVITNPEEYDDAQ